MKSFILFLLFITLPAMAQARDGVLEEYVENQPELSFGSEAEIRSGDLLVIDDFRERPPGLDRSQMEGIVAHSDFGYLETIGNDRRRPVKNSTNWWFGLAEVTAEIHEDLFYDRTGATTQLWFHVEIPGIIPQKAGVRFDPARFEGRRILVFGHIEDGYAVVTPRDVYLLDDDRRVSDIFGNEVDGEYLFALLRTRREVGNRSPFEAPGAAVIVGEMFGSMNDFRSTGLADFRVQDVLRGTSPDTVRVRMFGEPWFTHARARIRVGAAYLMAIKETAPGKYRCVNGKLGIFRVSDAGYLGTSGTAVEF